MAFVMRSIVTLGVSFGREGLTFKYEVVMACPRLGSENVNHSHFANEQVIGPRKRRMGFSGDRRVIRITTSVQL